jgi:hypothetical protein
MDNTIKNIINEVIKNISDNEIIVEKGTELYHGTIEEFSKEKTRVGGYDRIFWTTKDTSIAQTYIPQSGIKLYTSSEHIAMPTEDPTTINIQKAFGIEYDYSQVKFQNRRAVSYPEAPVFKEYSDNYWRLSDLAYKKYKEFEEFKKDYNEKSGKISDELEDLYLKKYEILEKEYDEIRTKERSMRIEKYKNEYINKKLQELGYEPTSTFDSNSNYQWKIKIDNDTIQPANYKAKGRVLIATPKRDLKIYDTTNRGRREGDLMDLDYHKHGWFEQAQQQGYDGIKINDYAQSADQGNVGHTSIGLFQSTLKDVDITEFEAVHNELEPHFQSGDWQSPEYKKYKQSLQGTVQEEIENWYPNRPTISLYEETTQIEKGQEGDCYKNVQDYLLDNDIPNAVIVHGVVTSRNGTLNHAWIETDTEVYDPTTGIKTDKQTYYSKLNPKVEARYTFQDAMKKRFSTGQFGPWTEAEEFDSDIDVAQNVANNLQKEPRPSSGKYILVNVDMQLADDAFKRDTGYYIGKDDKGILNRRLKVRDLIKSGELKYAPIVNILMSNYGEPILSFTDGRHRFAELRDAGVKTINLAVEPTAKKYIPLLQGKGLNEIAQKDNKKIYYHGRKMAGRPYSGSYIFITDNLGYASGYSDGEKLYTYTIPFGDDKIFSIKNPAHLNLLRKQLDDYTIQQILKASDNSEIDWAALSYIGTDEFENPEDLFQYLGFLAIRLKERTGIDSIFVFDEHNLNFEGEIDIRTPEMIQQIGQFYKDFTKDKNFLEEKKKMKLPIMRLPIFGGGVSEGTETIKDGDKYFNNKKTGMPLYDDVLNQGGGEGYQYWYKGYDGAVVYMSPDEYLNKTEKGFSKDYGAGAIGNMGWFSKKAQDAIVDAIKKGDKIDMPMLDYSRKDFGQEGRHRAVVARALGVKEMPVFIMRRVTPEEKIKRMTKIIEEAIHNLTLTGDRDKDTDMIEQYVIDKYGRRAHEYMAYTRPEILKNMLNILNRE